MNEMAFSSIYDVDHRHGHLYCPQPEHIHYVATEQYASSEYSNEYSSEEKHFRPNPDAKPFIPNVHAFSTNWHFYRNENGKNLNLPFIVNPQIDSDVMFANFSPNSSRKHIAFHLVSNVLDDEVMEEIQVSDVSNTLYNKLHPQPQSLLHPSEQNLYSNASWQTGSSSNFSLPLGVGKSSSDKSSINNKSIHEIWSPDPSPNELTQLSQTDDVMNSISQQSLENSYTESQRSFEKIEIDTSHLNMDYLSKVKEESVYYPQSPEYPIPPLPFSQYQLQSSNEVQQLQQKSHSDHHLYVGQQPFYSNSQYYSQSYEQAKVVCEQCGYFSCAHLHSQNQTKNKQMCNMYDLQVTYLEKLGISLDTCFDQLRHLDRDNRKADSSLSQSCCLRKSSSDLTSTKYPSNSTRVDKLVMDQEKEHQKVESLIGRIERQGLTPLHLNIGLTLDQWHTAIKELRNTRKSELASISDVPSEYSGGKSHRESDMAKLIDAVYKLAKHTRAVRTSVWCAMQMFYGNDKTDTNE
ncbi:uncharacterized protein LOC100202967 [Hydra vulgaris]|uniref:uncharacterized protein LOC100202967 n=1 Tax=Hydra vulgaris TaxID=6087 RepID=UPI001F5EF37F|nr:uncharacterized protein LOC100202967 [Hydra vulgaris]